MLALADTDCDTSSETVSADDNRGVATLTWDSAGNLGKVTSIYVTSLHVTPFHVTFTTATVPLLLVSIQSQHVQ